MDLCRFAHKSNTTICYRIRLSSPYIILMSKFRCCPKHPYINNIKVVLLNNKEICYKFTNDTLVEDIFHDVCSSMDLHERDIFGLAMLCNGMKWWIVL